VKTKSVGDDPLHSGQALEKQNYSYNIQGWLTGINKDYALSTDNNSQWNNHFGMYLGYEGDNDKFTNSQKQWNGSIRGAIWRSQGDNTPRKYDYEYDNINRFKAARFTQKDNPGDNNWGTSKVDLSAYITGYDANGNILGMQQTGIVPGTNGGVLLDNMQYQYYDWTNKLKNVTDLAATATSGKQGDFKDYAAANGIDYNYDWNGNLKYDKNKAIIANNDVLTTADPSAGIISNFLDLPQSITIKDKSRTEYTYDAAGNKLAKKVTSLLPNTPTPVTPKTTYYVGGFVYEDKDLQYILNEEGKLRIIEPEDAWSGPSGQVNYLQTTGNVQLVQDNTTNKWKWGVWDYFIKDNLSNTRMVLTEERHQQQMNCSMDGPNTVLGDEEERTFGYVDATGIPNATTNQVLLTRIDKPGSWPTSDNSSLKVAKLINNGTNAVGPNAILKVMAGDNIAATAKYHYVANGNSINNGIVPNIVSAIVQALGSSANIAGSIKDNIATTGNPYVTSSVTNFLNNSQPATPTSVTPRAYLNYIFFDEQFRYVPEQSGVMQVSPIASGNHIESLVFTPNDLHAPKNGYVYIYLSNESTNIPVYFDNMQVTHIRAAIVEDNVYYPHGLKVQGVSAKAALKPATKQGYQGDYSEEDEKTGYDEFALRSYDPQIGRWIQVDPYNVEPGMYNGMGNDPVNKVDVNGGNDDYVGRIGEDGIIEYFFDESITAQNYHTSTYANNSDYFYAGAQIDGDMERQLTNGQAKLFYGNSNTGIEVTLTESIVTAVRKPSYSQANSNAPTYIYTPEYEESVRWAIETNKKNQIEADKKPWIYANLSLTYGTFAANANVGNIKLGIEYSLNERDIIGRRDGKNIFMGEDKEGNIETRNYGGYNFGVVGGGIGMTTISGKKTYENIEINKVNLGPVSFETHNGKLSSSTTIAGFKIGFGIGLEGSININTFTPIVCQAPRSSYEISESTRIPDKFVVRNFQNYFKK
jgi:RHS repeat-associated protein